MNPDLPDDARDPRDRDERQRRERNDDDRDRFGDRPRRDRNDDDRDRFDDDDRPRRRRRYRDDDDFIDNRGPRKKGTPTWLVVVLCLVIMTFCLVPLLLPVVQKVREAAARADSTNNLKQIALGMHSYNDTMDGLPTAAIYDKQGRPLLSWRVALLPFIEQGALYKEFKLDEPWDSPHNIKLLSRMPKTYQGRGIPETAKEFKTHYRVFEGKGAIFDGKERLTLQKLPKGVDRTILVVESFDAVPWTKPDELHYAPNEPLKFKGVWPAGFLAMFADGSVKLIRKDVSEQDIRAAITRTGNPPPRFD